MAKLGRPSKYTPELATRVCNYIMAGLSLRQLEQKPGIPDKTTILRWMGHKDRDDFRKQYSHAKVIKAEAWIDEAQDIADNCEPGDVQKARLMVDTRVRLAPMLNPAYSTKHVQVAGTIEHRHAHLHASIDSRTDAALGISSTPKLTE